MNRRLFLVTAAASLAYAQRESAAIPDAIKKLKPMLDGVRPKSAPRASRRRGA
jgi:hypothetical protein